MLRQSVQLKARAAPGALTAQQQQPPAAAGGRGEDVRGHGDQLAGLPGAARVSSCDGTGLSTTRPIETRCAGFCAQMEARRAHEAAERRSIALILQQAEAQELVLRQQEQQAAQQLARLQGAQAATTSAPR